MENIFLKQEVLLLKYEYWHFRERVFKRVLLQESNLLQNSKVCFQTPEPGKKLMEGIFSNHFFLLHPPPHMYPTNHYWGSVDPWEQNGTHHCSAAMGDGIYGNRHSCANLYANSGRVFSRAGEISPDSVFPLLSLALYPWRFPKTLDSSKQLYGTGWDTKEEGTEKEIPSTNFVPCVSFGFRPYIYCTSTVTVSIYIK